MGLCSGKDRLYIKGYRQEVKVLNIDCVNYRIRSIRWGKEEFRLTKHPQGTEVKAITYSAMQIQEEEKAEVFVIIDI